MGQRIVKRAEIEAVAAQKQNEIARKLFDYDAVTQRMAEEAGKGKQHLRIMQELQVSLTTTPAAKELCDRLQKGGFGMEWVTAGQRVELVKNGSYELITYEELVIYWGASYGGGIG